MQKGSIRKKLLLERKKHPVLEKLKKDKKILARLLRMLKIKSAKSIFTYLSLDDEVSTDGLLKAFFGKKKIFVPIIAGREMKAFELLNNKKFAEGKFGVREPVSFKSALNKAKFDAIIVPGVAFDASGHRIGFGGGYFDKFLAKSPKKVRGTTIGLAYEFQIVDKIPVGKYDVAVDYIVTEQRLIDCKRFFRKQKA